MNSSIRKFPSYFQNVSVAQQFAKEVQCELQRIHFRSLVKAVRANKGNNPNVDERLKFIRSYMKRCEPFSSDKEKKVMQLLKDCEKYVGGLGISDSERLEILSAMTDIRKGAWYTCPNGHIYCIDACGGAMVTSSCPDCGSTIGGGQHRLRDDNSLATEMDGSSTHAWPQ